MCTTSANHRLRARRQVPRFVTDPSCTSRRVRRCCVISYALSRQPNFSSMSLRRLRRCVAAQANRTSHSRCFRNSSRRGGMFHVLSRQACLFPPSILSRLRCVRFLLERLRRKHCQVVSPITKLSFKVAAPPFVLQGNFHSFFMDMEDS